MLDSTTAARNALKAHDALREAEELEPAKDGEGMPVDGDAWLSWYNNVHRPAYERWSRTMDDLSVALDEPGMSRHPFNFRPRCEEILHGAAN